MVVNQKAVLDTANKHIVVDNTSLKPIIDADVQLYLTKLPVRLKVDGSNNIITDAINVTRQNEYISVNMDRKYSSMNSSVTSSAASAMKNTNVGAKIIEKTDALIYKIPTQTTYRNYILHPAKYGVIMNKIEELITPQNVFDVINISGSPETKSGAELL